MDAKNVYSTVEVISTRVSNELGDFTAQEIGLRGATKQVERPRIGLKGTQSKNCLGNMVEGLREATTVVNVPNVTPQGDKISQDEWNQAFWYACGKFGVPMWTQSSGKFRTFYFVSQQMFDKLAAKWKDGSKFAAYAGLLFSDMDGSEAIHVTVANVGKASDGQDGNCAVAPSIWGNMACQFRLMRLDEDGMPIALGKGIAVPLAGVEGMMVNDTQIKWGVAGDYIVLKNKHVGAKPLKMWISAEPILMLQDKPEVRRFLAARTQRKVTECLSYLTDKNRVGLLKWLGGLSLDDSGGLESAKRAVIEALRSKLPWCEELENRITRFLIRLIAESIIPSGGIQGYASTLVISNKHGVDACDWESAKAIAFRIPVTGANAIIPLPKDPFVKGKGMVVTGNVAKLASGDADGDLLTIISDKEVVELFRKFLNNEIVSGLKPAKTRAKAALTVEFLEDTAIELVSNAWMVGALTIAGWKMAQIGDFKAASEMLDLANVQPMTAKWDICYDDMPFAQYVNSMYGEKRDDLKAISLQWRDKAAESREWSSPRSLAEAGIANPSSHLDCCWNAGVTAAQGWAGANPLKPLSLSRVARLAFGENGIVISGVNWREAREVIKLWGSYWSENIGSKSDHGEIYRQVAEWGRNAQRESVAALLVWRPKNPENNGFSLKWHAVFASGRAVDVLGFDDAVKAAITELNQSKAGLERQLVLVEALLNTVQ
mgnify:CR=1 FL=1